MGATSRISGELNFSIFTIHVTFWSQRSVTEQFTDDQFYYMMIVNLRAFFFILNEELSLLSDVHEILSFKSRLQLQWITPHSKCIIHESRLSFICFPDSRSLFRAIDHFRYIKIQLESEAQRTQTEEMNKHVNSAFFVCVL